MKIGFPVDEENVCQSFGRALQFLIYDTKTDKTEIFENLAVSLPSGAGLKAAQQMIDLGAEGVVTYRLGENAAKAFKAAGIEIYKACEGDLNNNIKLAKDNALEKLNSFHAGYHGIR